MPVDWKRKIGDVVEVRHDRQLVSAVIVNLYRVMAEVRITSGPNAGRTDMKYDHDLYDPEETS
jgi:hypothetical protein